MDPFLHSLLTIWVPPPKTVKVGYGPEDASTNKETNIHIYIYVYIDFNMTGVVDGCWESYKEKRSNVGQHSGHEPATTSINPKP